jgi:integrase
LRPSTGKRIDLAAALAAVAEQPSADLTLAELVRGASVALCDGSETRLRKWVEAYGTTSAWSLTSEQLQVAAQAMRDHGYSPAAVNRDLSALGSVYRWAREKRLAPRGFRSPTLGVQRYEEPIRRVQIDAPQLEALKARALAFPDRRFGVYVSLLVDTGARKSELLERRGADFDLDRCEVLAPVTKNGAPRVLFFQQSTADLMRRVYSTLEPDRLVFEGRVPGQPISFRKAWETCTAEAGVPWLHQHDVRHAAAASLLRAGVTLPVAAQVLGHDPAVLARRYGHLETQALRQAQEQAWRLSGRA